MISSKLILLFCFYILLLLDNSLGQKTLVTQVGNKELLKHALDFGATFGGLLGLLGSQWKQLLIELVQAKRNVGLGKVHLARFNNSATTEEVGLVITESYADRVAELVAIRSQDIGTTQKYIDDLEILKNEIALTMVVEMDEIEEQFNVKNVREKVKEAKENGLTDEDIKELLFAQFIESEGLSLIGAGASALEALLSSFRRGMECLLYRIYSKKLCIIQYGNEMAAGFSLGNFVYAGDAGYAGGYDVLVGPGGSGGGGSGGPPTSPPSGPPGGADVPDDSHEEEGDKEEDKEEADLRICLAKTLRLDDKETNTEKPIAMPVIPWHWAHYNETERQNGADIVERTMRPILNELGTIDTELWQYSQMHRTNFNYNPIVETRTRHYQHYGEQAARRSRYYWDVLLSLLSLQNQFDEFVSRLIKRDQLTRQNQVYYQALSSTSASVVLPPEPPPIVEFENIPADIVNQAEIIRIRALVADIAWERMEYIASNNQRINQEICQIISALETLLRDEQDDVEMYKFRYGWNGSFVDEF